MPDVNPIPPGVIMSQNTVSDPSPISAKDWYSSTQLPSIKLNQTSADALTVTGNTDYYRNNLDVYNSVLVQYASLVNDFLAAQYNVTAINIAAANMTSPAYNIEQEQIIYNEEQAIATTAPTPWDTYNEALQTFQDAIANGDPYLGAAQQYNLAVEEFISAIDVFNSAVTNLNNAIDNYNNAVSAYNTQINIANDQIAAENIVRNGQGLPPLPFDAQINELPGSVYATQVDIPPFVSPLTPPDPLPSPITADPQVSTIEPETPPQISTNIADYTGGLITSTAVISQTISTLGTLVEYLGSITPVNVRKIQPLTSGIVPDHISMAAAVLGLGNPSLQRELTKTVLAELVVDADGKQLGLNFDFLAPKLDRFLAGITVEVLSLLGSITGIGIVGSITAGSSQGEINRALALGGAEEMLKSINSGGLTTRLSGLIQNAFPDATPAQRQQLLEQIEGPVTYILGGYTTAYLDQATGSSTSRAYYESFADVRDGIDETINTAEAQQVINDVIKKNLTSANQEQVDVVRQATTDAYAKQDNIADSIVTAYNMSSNMALDRSIAENIAFQSLKSLLALQRFKSGSIAGTVALADIEKTDRVFNDEYVISNQINNLNEARNALQFELSSSVNESVRNSLLKDFVATGSMTREQADEVRKGLQTVMLNHLKNDQINDLRDIQAEINGVFAKAGVPGDMGSQFLNSFTTALASRAGLPTNNYDIVNLLERFEKAVQEFYNHAEDVGISIIKSRNRKIENAANESFYDLMTESEKPSRILLDFLDPGKIITKVGLMYDGMQGGFHRGSTSAA